jgi:hypothetical protein
MKLKNYDSSDLAAPARDFLDAVTAPDEFYKTGREANVPDGVGGVTTYVEQMTDFVYTVPASCTRFQVQMHYPSGNTAGNGGALSMVACTDAGGSITVSFSNPGNKSGFDDNVIAKRPVGMELKLETNDNETNRAGLVRGGHTAMSQINAVTGASVAAMLPTIASAQYMFSTAVSYNSAEGTSVRWFPNAYYGVNPWKFYWHKTAITDWVEGPYVEEGSTTPAGCMMPTVLLTGTAAGRTYHIRAIWLMECVVKSDSVFPVRCSPGAKDFESLVAMSNDWEAFPVVSSFHTFKMATEILSSPILKEAGAMALGTVGPYLIEEALKFLRMRSSAPKQQRKKGKKAKKNKRKVQ